jgi:hypothetical protein
MVPRRADSQNGRNSALLQAMAQQNLGPEIHGRLKGFARAVREQGLEPVSFHLGAFQWQQLRDYAAELHQREHYQTVAEVPQLTLDGLPIWRHPEDHHIEVETIGTIGWAFLEACLVK